jgi:hypothetical protein
MSSNSDDFDDSTFILDETDSKSIAPVMYEPEPIPRNDSEHSSSVDDSSEEPDDEPGENIHKDHWLVVYLQVCCKYCKGVYVATVR